MVGAFDLLYSLPLNSSTHPGMTEEPLNPHWLGVIELEYFKYDEYNSLGL